MLSTASIYIADLITKREGLIMSKPITILGSGMIGGQTARLIAAAGVDVIVTNTRGPESLKKLVAELGPTARAASAEDAIQAADIVVVAIPFDVYSKLSPDLLAGKIVVDDRSLFNACLSSIRVKAKNDGLPLISRGI